MTYSWKYILKYMHKYNTCMYKYKYCIQHNYRWPRDDLRLKPQQSHFALIVHRWCTTGALHHCTRFRLIVHQPLIDTIWTNEFYVLINVSILLLLICVYTCKLLPPPILSYMQSSNLGSNMFWLKKKKFECFWLKKYSVPEKNYIWAANPKQSPCGENWFNFHQSVLLSQSWLARETVSTSNLLPGCGRKCVGTPLGQKSGRKCVGNPEKNWRHISRVTDSTPCRFADAPKLQFCLALALNRGNVPRSRVNSKNAQNLSKNVNMCTLCIKCVRYCCVASNSAAAGID